MKKLGQISFLITLIFLTSCSKDKTPHLYEPNGNLLVLELDTSFEVTGASQLIIEDLKINEGKLELDFDNSTSDTRLVTSGSNNTIFKISDGFLAHPTFTKSPMLEDRDDRLYNNISETDFTFIFNTNIDFNKVFPNIGNYNLVHSYLANENSSKISVLKLVLNQYNEALQISTPIYSSLYFSWLRIIGHSDEF